MIICCLFYNIRTSSHAWEHLCVWAFDSFHSNAIPVHIYENLRAHQSFYTRDVNYIDSTLLSVLSVRALCSFYVRSESH